jgi:uncharacterized membrane protein
MYDFLLIIHFFGLAIGAGTPFYMAALAVHAETSADPVKVKAIMLGPGAAVSWVGVVGLVLMVLSGVLMLAALRGVGDLDWSLATKIGLVVVVCLYVSYMKLLSHKAKREEGMATMAAMKKLAPLGPLLSVAVIVLSVLAFH